MHRTAGFSCRSCRRRSCTATEASQVHSADGPADGSATRTAARAGGAGVQATALPATIPPGAAATATNAKPPSAAPPIPSTATPLSNLARRSRPIRPRAAMCAVLVRVTPRRRAAKHTRPALGAVDRHRAAAATGGVCHTASAVRAATSATTAARAATTTIGAARNAGRTHRRADIVARACIRSGRCVEHLDRRCGGPSDARPSGRSCASARSRRLPGSTPNRR